MPIKLITPRKGKTPYWSGRGTYLGIRIDRSTKARKRAVALKIIAKWEREIERGEFSERGEPTFASAAAAYMKAGGERRFLKRPLEHFGETPIRQIDQPAIDAAAASLYAQASGATRNRQVYSPVSAVLRRAGRKVDLRRPADAAGNKATTWLWPEQAEAIFAEAEKLDPEFATLLIVLCYTGLRIGEALRLEWNDVRLVEAFAYVPDTKNGDPRPVFLPPVVVAALANVPQRDDRVFRWRHRWSCYKPWKRVLNAAGVRLPNRVAFHVWCHTYGTWMRRYAQADDATLLATQRWKDKKSVARYVHVVVSEEAQRAALLPTPKVRKG